MWVCSSVQSMVSLAWWLDGGHQKILTNKLAKERIERAIGSWSQMCGGCPHPVIWQPTLSNLSPLSASPTRTQEKHISVHICTIHCGTVREQTWSAFVLRHTHEWMVVIPLPKMKPKFRWVANAVDALVVVVLLRLFGVLQQLNHRHAPAINQWVSRAHSTCYGIMREAAQTKTTMALCTVI